MYLRALLYLCAIALILPLKTAAQTPPSAFDLAKAATHSELALSPNGRYLAFEYATTEAKCTDSSGRVMEGKTNCSEKRRKYRASYQMAIYDLETRSLISLLPLPEDFYVLWYEWANNDRLLAAIALRTTSNNRGTKVAFGGSRIVSIPREQGEYVTLFEDSRNIRKSNFRISAVTNTLPNDPDHVIIPAYKGYDLDLWKVNVTNGEFERIAVGKEGTFLWFTNKEGKPVLRFDVTRFGTRIYVHAWSDETQDWERIRTIKPKRWNENQDLEFRPLAATDNPNHLIVVSDEEDGLRRAIKIYDLKEKKYVETLYEHAKYDISGGFVNSSTGEFAAAWYYEDKLQYHFADKNWQGHYFALQQFFNNDANIDILDFDESSDRAVLFVSAPEKPGEYYIYDRTNAKLDPIFSSRPELANVKFGEADILTIPTRDGAEVTAYLTHPAAGTENSAPLIVMPHGGPEGRDVYDFDSDVQYLATRGYRILQVNFRGSSGYGREFAKSGYGEWGGTMQNDVTDAVRYVHNLGVASPETTCINGYSYGGYVALQGAVATPELYACVISGGGVSDLLASLRETRRDFGSDSEPYDYWTRSIGDPSTDKEKLIATSPINFADRVIAPVLLIHGADDEIVYPSQSRKMNNALKKAGVDVTYIEVKYEGHRIWSLENEIVYHSQIEAFLSKHLRQ